MWLYRSEQTNWRNHAGKIRFYYSKIQHESRSNSKTITVETNATNVEGGLVALKIKGEVIVKQEVNLLDKKKTGPMQ